MNSNAQLKERQYNNERILVEMLRKSAKPDRKTRLQQLRADVADIAAKNRKLTLVK